MAACTEVKNVFGTVGAELFTFQMPLSLSENAVIF